MSLKKEFVDWACSLSGCDGGNPEADIWVSGIEWGGGDEKYYSELPDHINEGEHIPAGRYDWKDSLTYTYGRNVAKLVSVIKGKNVEEYQEYANNAKGNELFRLNLYPIAFRNTDESLWKHYRLDKITGFEEKELFRTWCFLNRFPAIAKIVAEQKKPKIIIGTGVSYLTDFFSCFAGKNGIKTHIHTAKIPSDSSKPSNQYQRRYYWAHMDNGSTLYVIPFFSGQYGLNSNYLIQQMGEIIRDQYLKIK